MHGPSLLEEDKPQRECEQSSQTGISQYWEREHNLKAQQQPAGYHREQQTQCQAREPSREEGPQNVKGRSPSTARQHKCTEGYHIRRNAPEPIRAHGRVFLALAWI